MLKPGLLATVGITVPDGQVCSQVNIVVKGKNGRPQIIESITSPKRLGKMAHRMHGVTLEPVFIPNQQNESI